MIKKSIAILIVLFVSLNIVAQTTYYYKLTKKVVNGKQSTNVSGGQFITFKSNTCFESNKKGIGVGHGIMRKNESFSTSSVKVYTGNSYWGSSAYYKFNNDLSTLNVVTNDGTIYLYKRTVAPANVTTCSLIRKQGSSGSSASPVYPTNPQPSYPATTYPQNNQTQQNSGSSTQQKKWRYYTEEVTCGTCHGTKTCNSCAGKGTVTRLGMGSSANGSRCTVCGGSGRCNTCSGRGTVTKQRSVYE